MSRRSICSAALLSVAIVAALAGNAVAANLGLGAAKEFDGYKLYWAGPSVAGLPLEDVTGVYPPRNGAPPSRWYFAYGSCEPHGTDHPSCSPPLSIQLDSTCNRWAGELLPKRARPFAFRGAKAYWQAKNGPFEIFTGRTTVVVWAQESSAAMAAAEQLRTFDQEAPAPLPAPVPDSLWGKLPCQTSPAR